MVSAVVRFLAFAVLTSILVLLSTSNVLAEEWVAKMFPEKDHDFGTVARGSDTVYRFPVKNVYKQDTYLVGVRSSCGCTTPSIENEILKTGDTGYIVASFNTRTFTGRHGATLTVEVEWDDNGRRRRGETQLHVHGNIRGDLVFQPGAVKFDNVDQGAAAERTVRVTYAGRADWRVVDVRGANEAFEVEMTEKQRSAGRVAYEFLIRLKDSAPAGYFNEQLVLVTNDDQDPRIPLHIQGRVVSEISVAPESLVLGDVPLGQQVSKKIVVRGKNPFRIVSVECQDDCFQFKAGEESSARHVVEVVFDSKRGNPGKVKETIQIMTDLGERYHATLTAYANVLPGENASTAINSDSAGGSQRGKSDASTQTHQLASD